MFVVGFGGGGEDDGFPFLLPVYFGEGIERLLADGVRERLYNRDGLQLHHELVFLIFIHSYKYVNKYFHNHPLNSQSGVDKKFLALCPNSLDLFVQVRSVVLQNRHANHVPRRPACLPQRFLRRHEHVRHILLLAEDGEVQHYFDGEGVGCDDDEFGDASVEGFGRLVGSLFDLFEGGTLGDKFVDLGGELLGGEGLGSFRRILNTNTAYHIVEL